MTLRVPIQSLVEHGREERWRAEGVPEPDIAFSAQCGMDACDVRALRETTLCGRLIIVRCPKRAARPWHGVLPPKPLAVKRKTGDSGVAVLREIAWNEPRTAFTVTNDDPRMYVSDYDLMSVWRQDTHGAWTKIFISAVGGAARGPWTSDARDIVREMNARLVSHIQHGCQDDFQSTKNPGVDVHRDHFAAFIRGRACYQLDAAACARFHREQQLPWLYDAIGRYIGPIANRNA